MWSDKAAGLRARFCTAIREKAMAKANGNELPFLVAGGGIGGPIIFRAIERVGLKASMMDDAWVPPKIEMRDAVSGNLVTDIPLGEPFMKRFGQPYAVTHRADIHGVYLRACQGNNLVSLENNRKVDDFVDEGDEVTIRLEGGEEIRGRALI